MPDRHPNETALLHAGGTPGLWGNLGLWPARDYAQACERLALHLARAAGPLDGQRVLSPGCGAGEELALWVGRLGARAALGIDPSVPRNCGGPWPPPPDGVRLVQGDARDLEAMAGGDHDVLICVDAAYLLSPRARWLEQARRVLRPGGVLVFSDLVIAPRWWPGALLRALLKPLERATGIASADLIDPASACRRVAAAGFVDVRLERLDEAVLDGFAAFVAAQELRLGPLAASAGWKRPAATARLLRRLRPLGLGYAVLAARVPGAAARPPAGAAPASS